MAHLCVPLGRICTTQLPLEALRPCLRPWSTSQDQANQTDRASFPPAVSCFTWKELFGFVSCLPSHFIKDIRHLVTFKQLRHKAGLPKCFQLKIHKRIMFVCQRKREKEKSFLIQVENVVSVRLKGKSELKNVSEFICTATFSTASVFSIGRKN